MEFAVPLLSPLELLLVVFKLCPKEKSTRNTYSLGKWGKTKENMRTSSRRAKMEDMSYVFQKC